MGNSLGSLAPFQIDPNQDFSATGMRYATGFEGGNRPTVAPVQVGPPSPGEAGSEQKAHARPPAPQLSIPELLADCEKALLNCERHYAKRDCSELEKQIRSELLSQLLGFHVAAEVTRAMEVLRSHYDERWAHRTWLRDGSYKFRSVVEARKCHGRLIAAKSGADFLAVAWELFETCKVSMSDPVCQAGILVN